MTRPLFAAVLASTVVGASASQAGPATQSGDPYEAFAQGRYEESLEAFLNRQVAHPNDPRAALNVGAAQYELRRYDAAERAFEQGRRQATRVGDQATAFYDLGNAAYRQGRLQQAVDAYRAALNVSPQDEDAKFNLDLAQRKMQEMRQQQQNQQQPQKQQGQSQGQQPQPQPQQQQPQDQQPKQEQESTSSDGPAAGSDDHKTAADPSPKGGPRMSRAEAERLLHNLDERRPKAPPRPSKSSGAADW